MVRRLSAGGSWIRTCSTAAREPWISAAFRAWRRINGALKRYHLIVQPFFFCASNHSIEPGWGTANLRFLSGGVYVKHKSSVAGHAGFRPRSQNSPRIVICRAVEAFAGRRQRSARGRDGSDSPAPAEARSRARLPISAQATHAVPRLFRVCGSLCASSWGRTFSAGAAVANDPASACECDQIELATALVASYHSD
jgi:hypothetical protein